MKEDKVEYVLIALPYLEGLLSHTNREKEIIKEAIEGDLIKTINLYN